MTDQTAAIRTLLNEEKKVMLQACISDISD